MTTIPATEVKNRFGAVLRSIDRSGEPLVIERSGRPVAVIMSIETYRRVQPRAHLSDSERDLIWSAFGMWAGRTDLDDQWLAAGRHRWLSEWQHES